MSLVGDALELTEKIQKSWRDPAGLFAAVALVALLSSLLSISVSARVAVGGTVGAAATLYWLWCRRTPRVESGRVGIAIAIKSASNQSERQFVSDFTGEIRSLLRHGRVGHTLQLLQVPEHVFRGIDLADGEQVDGLRQRVRCSFILAGEVRVRKIGSRDHLVLDLIGGVAHKPIPDVIQKRFEAEFSELLPRRIAVPTDHDLLAFTVTGTWTNLVAKYVIGIAAALSGDLVYAESLYETVRDEASLGSAGNPVAAKIQSRIPVRLAEIHEARANEEYRKWSDSRLTNHAIAMKRHLEKIDPSLLAARRYLALRAISAFVVDGDPDEALRLLDTAKNDADGLWYWNAGFLHAFKGNLKRASQYYRNGSLAGLPPEVPAQVEEFLTWAVDAFPDRPQLHYCLGVLNRDVKGDAYRAREEFETFLSKCNDKRFAREQEQVRRWLKLDKGQDERGATS